MVLCVTSFFTDNHVLKAWLRGDPDAARLYQELLQRNIDTTIHWVDNPGDPSLIEFHFDGKVVRSSENWGELEFE